MTEGGDGPEPDQRPAEQGESTVAAKTPLTINNPRTRRHVPETAAKVTGDLSIPGVPRVPATRRDTSNVTHTRRRPVFLRVTSNHDTSLTDQPYQPGPTCFGLIRSLPAFERDPSQCCRDR